MIIKNANVRYATHQSNQIHVHFQKLIGNSRESNKILESSLSMLNKRIGNMLMMPIIHLIEKSVEPLIGKDLKYLSEKKVLKKINLIWIVLYAFTRFIPLNK